jgi:hypothetical protein
MPHALHSGLRMASCCVQIRPRPCHDPNATRQIELGRSPFKWPGTRPGVLRGRDPRSPPGAPLRRGRGEGRGHPGASRKRLAHGRGRPGFPQLQICARHEQRGTVPSGLLRKAAQRSTTWPEMHERVCGQMSHRLGFTHHHTWREDGEWCLLERDPTQ